MGTSIMSGTQAAPTRMVAEVTHDAAHYRHRVRRVLLSERRRWGIAFVLLASLLFGTAACSTSPSTGEIVGVARGCGPRPLPGTTSEIGEQRVVVSVSQNGRVVASKSVRSGATYEFDLMPGDYLVSASSTGVPNTSVTLAANGVAHVNLFLVCHGYGGTER
jgi:hypothetical protein